MTKGTQRAHCSLQWSAKKSASAFYPLDPQKKIRSDRPHFTRCSIHRSAFYRKPFLLSTDQLFYASSTQFY